RETLEALLAQQTPAGLAWEVLVADNGSADGTLEVFRTMAMRAGGRLRYVFEPRLGKSRALNAGIAVARGAVIALTDDDVSPAVDWVATAAVVLDKWGVAGAGGRIRPRWEAEPPSWLLESPRLLDYLAIMEYERPAMMPIPAGKYPQVWGANMVYRRAALQALGGFDVNLGPVGGRRFCNEDVDIVRRMLQSGRAVAYDPGLTVFHRIPRARLRRAYFRQVMWDMGEGEARAAAEPPGGPRILGIPRWRIRFLARMAVHSTVRTLARRPGAFSEMLDYVYAAGVAWGQLKRAVRERRARGLLVPRRPGGVARGVRAPR
ncbi:MAG TPA: glycosyltransferase, partial [Candidatus Dormibacteraeota bacterium]|nr:glycosyltransferase [Candidatus Dormibacteraeota bacterium]